MGADAVLAVAAIVIVAAGIAAGVLQARRSLRAGAGVAAQIRNGAWGTGMLTGSTKADALTRARVAISGLLALDQKECIYFIAARDDSGEPLSSEHEYEIKGTAPDARWWSITVYGPDYFLIANPGHRYSFSSKTIKSDQAGGFTIRLARDQRDGAWLPTGEGRFVLNLRLYNPSETLRRDRATVPLPRIVRVGGAA